MDIKFNCPNKACQQRVSVDESMAGKSVNCPGCGTPLHVPTSTSIKFNCSSPGCGQHIVVDVAEAGRFVRCPSCGKPAQVPGDPPKPLVKPLVSQKPSTVLDDQYEELVEEELADSSLPPFKRLLCGWGAGLALVTTVLAGSYFCSQMAMPRHLNAMAEELFAVGDFRGAPVPNNDKTALIFARNVKDGGAIFFTDLATHKTSMLVKQEEGQSMDFSDNNLVAWSPDDSCVALPQRTGRNQSSRRIAVCDPYTGEVKRSFDVPADIKQVRWLNTNSLVVFGNTALLYLINLSDDTSLGRVGNEGVNQLDVPPLDYTDDRRHWITRTSDHTIAYIDRGNVWSLDIATGQMRQLSHLSNATLEYLDFNPNKGEFLFGLTDKKHRNALYRLNPDDPNGLGAVTISEGGTNMAVSRVTKGQWILGGKGIAYLKGSLILKMDGTSTSLFSDGNIQSYTVAPGGNKIYALATTGSGPLSLWEYDIPTRQLHNVVPATDKSFSATQVVLFQEGRYKGQDGNKRVTYGYLPPANMKPGKKYPAVICVPRGGLWEPDGQLMANAGIFYASVAVGVGVTNESGLSGKEQEMLTTYYALLNDPNVDSRRIYIMGASHETEWLKNLMEAHPTLWRGAIFIAPVMFPEIRNTSVRFPSIFISMGDQDEERRRENVARFVQTAYQQHVSVRLHNDRNGGHILASTELAQERYESMVKFILSGY